jgi:hypothetical protein
MRRSREAQLARLAARATAADDAATWRSAALEARAKVGAALRQALAQSGIDPQTVAMLRVSDEAAQELAAAADRPPQHDAAAPRRIGDRRPDLAAGAFAERLGRLVRRYRDGRGVDLARSSLAEALAWCLARQENSPAAETQGGDDASDAGLFAADLLQKQQQDRRR